MFLVTKGTLLEMQVATPQVYHFTGKKSATRMITFELIMKKAGVVEYVPDVLTLNDPGLPEYLGDTIEFDRSELPAFMSNVISAIANSHD